MSDRPVQLSTRDLRRRFDRAAATFDEAAFAHNQIADGIFDRLAAMSAKPERVVDLGCGTGYGSTRLSKAYKGATIVSVDQSQPMLDALARKRGWFSRIRPLQADASRLPLCDRSMGLAYANLLLPWLPNPDPLFHEVARVLRKDAPFVFSTLGPDSFAELGDAFASVDESPRINAFADMHDIGDGLVRAGLSDPVLDVERIEVSYKDASSLLSDLTKTGARNSLSERRRGLLGRAAFAEAVEKLSARTPFTITLEVVFGHAFGSGQSKGIFAFDAGQVPIRRTKNS